MGLSKANAYKETKWQPLIQLHLNCNIKIITAVWPQIVGSKVRVIKIMHTLIIHSFDGTGQYLTQQDRTGII